MRIEPFIVGSHVHIIKRGARGMPIVKDDSDRWHFLCALFYMNDEYLDPHWLRNHGQGGPFFRSDSWPLRKPLVDILAYTLMPNHFHLLLRETHKGGVALFMKKLGQSMSQHHNEKYKEKGSIFQGSYKSKTIDSDIYLRYVAIYIMVKNTFELYPKGGLETAIQKFEDVWNWAEKYNFSSLADYSGKREHSPILKKGLLGELFSSTKVFKSFAHDVIKSGKWKSSAFEG